MPPDLSEAARSLAVLPPQSCGEAICANPHFRPSTEHITSSNDIVDGGLQSLENHSSPRPVAENFASHNGSDGQFHQPHSQVVGPETGNSGGQCDDKGAEKPVLSSIINMYHLTPALRATFASVGATDKTYPFREVLLLLKKYLFSKVHLFDPKDKLYVNCGNDPLGQALQVDRFHYNDVKSLISKHIIRAQPEPTRQHTSVPDRLNGTCSQTANIGSHPRTLNGYASDGRTSSSGVVNNGINVTNGRTELLVPISTTAFITSTNYGTSVNPRGHVAVQQGTSVSIPIAGPSWQREERLDLKRCSRTTKHLSYTFILPEVPDSNSDAESTYSIQGYETAFCHNTEFEETDDEEEDNDDSYEEFEIASDDAKEEECSDDDDSVTEDVEIALLAFHALCQDESEEDFWADDSDTEDQCSDDPELIVERWDCLSCGIKNKPFVRYCDKCWQLRKNWLPDRPRKRRRKPRPKKRHSRFRSESIQSDEQSADKNFKRFESISSASSLSSTCDSQEPENLEELARTSSTASTVLLRSDNPYSSYCLDKYSSQDSGISLSQDMFVEFGEELSVEDTQVKTEDIQVRDSRTRTEDAKISKALTSLTDKKSLASKGSCFLATVTSSSTEAKLDTDASRSRKRKYSTSEDVKPRKRAKLFKLKESSSDEYKNEVNIEDQARGFAQFLQTATGKERLNDICIEAQAKGLAQYVESRGEERLIDTCIEAQAKGLAYTVQSPAGKERLNNINMEAITKGFVQFLETAAGEEWLNSRDGKQFLYSQSVQDVLVEAYGADMSIGSSDVNSFESSLGHSSLCSICCLRPKNAAIIHGRLSHQATCYQCARRLHASGSRCPVCRRKIHMVCKHIIT